MFAEWMRQARAWLSSRRFDEDLDEEMQFHRDMREQELRGSGLSPQEAKRQANISFGRTLTIREESRESWGIAWLDSIGQDLRYGLRQLNRNRGFAVTAILTIALGVGASAAIFTLVNAVLLRPLPYPEPDRLFVLYEELHVNPRLATPDLDLHHIKNQLKSFSGIGAWARSSVNWRTAEEAILLQASAVDRDLLQVLGFQPALGRAFTLQEEREAANVIILSHATWVSRFGADSSVVGSTSIVDNEVATIVGVASPRFRIDWRTAVAPEAYTLISRNPAYRTNGQGHNSWRYIARLRPGVAPEQARAEWEGLQAAWVQDQPTDWLRQEPVFRPFVDETFEYYRPKLWTMAGAGSLVFLIVCTNLGGLLLARSVARRKEIGVRTSLGAARGRIARQLSVEVALLALLGGAAGLLLCW